MTLHARTRNQNLVPAPAPVTRHGQELVPVPAIRGQGSPAGMSAYPPKMGGLHLGATRGRHSSCTSQCCHLIYYSSRLISNWNMKTRTKKDKICWEASRTSKIGILPLNGEVRAVDSQSPGMDKAVVTVQKRRSPAAPRDARDS